jgi:UTP--glucose-1-phosphate uridylyltransferase
VQPTHESLITRFGVIGAQPLQETESLYQVDRVAEKPTPTEAETNLLVAGLRAGFYLAFFGMHVFTPTVMEMLGRYLQEGRSAPVSAALNELPKHERYLACRTGGERYDLGPRFGLLYAQMALTLCGPDREEFLSTLTAMLANQCFTGAQSGGR